MGDGAVPAAAPAENRCARVELTCWKGYDQSLTGNVRRMDGTTRNITLGCRGFVIDRTGVSAAQDWDGILTGTGARFTTGPDTVGILRERVPEHPELAGSDATEYGALHVFHRP
ncbi:hypothetical protein [Streptomyces fagopyri]|uniref:hypothetical protein n=1 Tax=Streptomyces fagopyri TaxID=2662397 RepID=UPI0033E44BFF